MPDPMPVPDTVPPADVQVSTGSSFLDRVRDNPRLVALLGIGAIVGIIWLLRSRGTGAKVVTIPTVMGVTNPLMETPVVPAPQQPTGGLTEPSSGYNLVVDVMGSGEDFIESLRQFNIVGRVIGTSATTETGHSRVELNVPTGSGQSWFSTLANDIRVMDILPGSGYTSPDKISGWQVFWKRLPEKMPSSRPAWWPENLGWPPELQVAPPDFGDSTTYVVKAGDYLIKIANQFKVTLGALLAANPQISNPNLIYSGQKITIPKA